MAEKQICNLVPGFSRVLTAGYRNRGFGGDFAVLNGRGELVAALHDNFDTTSPLLSFRDSSRANMMLFVAAPALYAACEAALVELHLAGRGQGETARRLATVLIGAINMPPPLPRRDWRVMLRIPSEGTEDELEHGHEHEADAVAELRRLRDGVKKRSPGESLRAAAADCEWYVVGPDGERHLVND